MVVASTAISVRTSCSSPPAMTPCWLRGPAANLEPPLRATRLGRLVITLVVAAAIALLGGGLAGQLASAGADPRSVTVVPGDTLSEIAARELPGLPIAEGIVEIQLANSLSSDQVSAGQRIIVPMP